MVAVLSLYGCDALYRQIGGDFVGEPAELAKEASPLARELIAEAKVGLNENQFPGAPIDHHFHLAGVGTGVSRICPEIEEPGVWLNPDYSTWLHPVLRFKRGVIMSASGVDDIADADAQYVERFLELVRHSGLSGTYLLYALDWRYENPGDKSPNREGTDLFVDSQYVVELAKCLNEKETNGARFLPVASVHPYKRGAKEELTKLANQGVKYVKWLPPAQNIDPAHVHNLGFYQVMARNGMILLSHTGDEHTFRVQPEENQDLADPLRLVLPLEEGVTVVMLHSAREGKLRNLEHAAGLGDTYFKRFLAMMKRYDKNLFGELSVVPYLGTHERLKQLFHNDNIRSRIVDGTDYPNPAIAIINPTDKLLEAGYLTRPTDPDASLARKRKEALDQIYSYNPLLFDFVLKRSLRIDGDPIPTAVFYDIGTKRQMPYQDR